MKKQESESRSHKAASYSKPTSGKTSQSVHFQDNRLETAVQLKLQDTANQTIQLKSNNTGLPAQLKSGIETLSGHSMDDVKVHYNSSKPAQLQAHAFAQGNQIHLAPGQEKHLPHEAWHVVQQKQGRVKPTKQLKSKVNINDDPFLEKEADVMGAKAMQLKSFKAPSLLQNSTSRVAQLKNLTQAGLNGPYALTNANTHIFDSPRMAQGQEYSRAIPSAANAYKEVINAYTTQIRPLGSSLSSKKYTDERFPGLPDVPGQNKLSGLRKQEIITDLVNAGIISNRVPYNNYQTLRSTVSAFKSRGGNRNAFRNNDDLETIDPFMVKMTINPPLPAPDWEIHTQFSDSGTGYIVKIKRGDTNTSGSIATSGAFNHGKNTATANQHDYSYSSTHDRGKASFGSKIESMTAHTGGDVKGKFHEGFDAMTWMAAEGARFRPVKTVGSRATPQTKFFIFPNVKNWKTIKAVDLTWLMLNWGEVFHKKYNIKAKEIANIVRGRGTIPFPTKGLMYNLNTGKIVDAQKYGKWRGKNNWQKLESLDMVTGKEVRIMKENVRRKKVDRKAYYEAGRPGHERPDPVG